MKPDYHPNDPTPSECTLWDIVKNDPRVTGLVRHPHGYHILVVKDETPFRSRREGGGFTNMRSFGNFQVMCFTKRNPLLADVGVVYAFCKFGAERRAEELASFEKMKADIAADPHPFGRPGEFDKPWLK
jgi:hypothetical protein